MPVGVSSGAGDLARLIIAVVVLVAVLAWQTSRITRAKFPELRAAVALGVVIPVFFVLFATIYLSMSHASGTTFTQGLDHTRALYFTITVFSTVGFGDITPATDPARLVVSAQMILDLVLIGGVVRILVASEALRERARPNPPRSTPTHDRERPTLAFRARRLAESCAHPVVRAALVQSRQEFRAPPGPAPDGTPACSRSDGLSRVRIVATHHRDGCVRACLSEDRVDRLLV